MVTYATPALAMAAFNNRPFYIKHKIENNIITESYVEYAITPEISSLLYDLTDGAYTLNTGIYTLTGGYGPTVFQTNVNTIFASFGESANLFCDYDDFDESILCNADGTGVGATVFGTMGAFDGDYGCALGIGSDNVSHGISFCGLTELFFENHT